MTCTLVSWVDGSFMPFVCQSCFVSFRYLSSMKKKILLLYINNHLSPIHNGGTHIGGYHRRQHRVLHLVPHPTSPVQGVCLAIRRPQHHPLGDGCSFVVIRSVRSCLLRSLAHPRHVPLETVVHPPVRTAPYVPKRALFAPPSSKRRPARNVMPERRRRQ